MTSNGPLHFLALQISTDTLDQRDAKRGSAFNLPIKAALSPFS